MMGQQPWQFEFGLIPSTTLTRHWALDDHSRRVREADREGLWNGTSFPSLVAGLDRMGLDSHMVGASLVRWGEGDENFIDVLVEAGRVCEVKVMLDLRVHCLKFISDFTLAANRHQWLVITTEGMVFRPTVRRCIVEIEESAAMRWVRGSMNVVVRRKLGDSRISPSTICE
jgi:hypothetical protein